jgi:hypothetical protein
MTSKMHKEDFVLLKKEFNYQVNILPSKVNCLISKIKSYKDLFERIKCLIAENILLRIKAGGLNNS